MAYIQNSYKDNNKQYCTIKTTEDIEKIKQEFKKSNNFDNFFTGVEAKSGHKFTKFFEITVNAENYSSDFLEKLETLISQVPASTNLSIMIQNDNSALHVKDLEQFIDLEDKLLKQNKELYFTDGTQLYTLTETIGAEEQIENFTTKINATTRVVCLC